MQPAVALVVRAAIAVVGRVKVSAAVAQIATAFLMMEAMVQVVVALLQVVAVAVMGV